MGKKLTIEDIKNIIEDRGYIFLDYEIRVMKNNKKVKYVFIQCNEGHKYWVDFNNFKRGYNCKKCRDNKRKNSQQEVEEYYNQFGYELLDEYKNNRTPLKMKCPNGHITNTMTYWSFKNGNRCPECSRKAKLSYEHVKEQFENEGYEMISNEYKNANTKLKVKCPKGHEWDTTYAHFYDGKRCPHCKTSKGENKVKEILDELKIKYIQQYKFDDCKINYKLSFDFYLPQYNCCIEYDGKQHFEIVEHFGGLDGFISTKIRDTYKNWYCEKNNIKMIRISYKDFKNIEEILNKEFKIIE